MANLPTLFLNRCLTTERLWLMKFYFRMTVQKIYFRNHYWLYIPILNNHNVSLPYIYTFHFDSKVVFKLKVIQNLETQSIRYHTGEVVPLWTFCLKLPSLLWGIPSGLGALHHMREHHVGPRPFPLELFRRFLINLTNLTHQSNVWPADSLFHFPGWGSSRQDQEASPGSALLLSTNLLESISCRRGKTFHNFNEISPKEDSQMLNTLFSLIFYSDTCLHLLMWTQSSAPAHSDFLAYLYNWSNLMHVFFFF